jgi:hypothetical protein
MNDRNRRDCEKRKSLLSHKIRYLARTLYGSAKKRGANREPPILVQRVVPVALVEEMAKLTLKAWDS